MCPKLEKSPEPSGKPANKPRPRPDGVVPLSRPEHDTNPRKRDGEPRPESRPEPPERKRPS